MIRQLRQLAHRRPGWPLTWPRFPSPPEPPEVSPMEFAVFACLTFAVARTALGLLPLPNSLDAAPTLWGQCSAIGITVGSALAVVGMLWKRRDDGAALWSFGCVLCGFGSLFYAVALLVNTTPHASAIAAGVMLGVAAGCAGRIWLIQRWLNHRRATIIGEAAPARRDKD